MSLEAGVLAIVTSVAAGLMGSFAVMRRMSLAADPCRTWRCRASASR